MKTLIAGWERGRVPIVNGVLEASGRVHPIRPVKFPRTFSFALSAGEPTEWAQLRDVAWSVAIPNQRVQDSESGQVILVGECGWGGDGFVALQAADDPASLVWLAFFDFSNPFVSVRVDESVVVATNNLGQDWHFDRSAPWRIGIRAA